MKTKKRKLTWQGASRRWRKIYKKKAYYFHQKVTETKEQSYQRAIVEWMSIKNEIDAAGRTQEQQFLDWCVENGIEPDNKGPFIIIGTDVYHMTTGLLCTTMASHDRAQEFVIIASRDTRWRTDNISFLRETMRGYAVAIKQHINGCVLNPQARRRLKHVGIEQTTE